VSACNTKTARAQAVAQARAERKLRRQRLFIVLERIRERALQRDLADLERRSARKRRSYAANSDRHKGFVRRWQKNNPGAVRAIAAKRRALQLAQRCTCCTDEQIQHVYDIAALCGPGAHVDHIIPLVLGGPHCSKNLTAITAEAHRGKTKLDMGLIAEARRRSRSPVISLRV
jgi:hypothetical protein